MIDGYLRQHSSAHWLYVLMFTLLIVQSEIWRYLGIRMCMHSRNYINKLIRVVNCLDYSYLVLEGVYVRNGKDILD